MEEKNPMMWVFVVVFVLILGAIGGYWYGNKAGYKKAQDDAKAMVEAEAKKAAETANPFKSTEANPLKTVNTNPLKSLKFNPFK